MPIRCRQLVQSMKVILMSSSITNGRPIRKEVIADIERRLQQQNEDDKKAAERETQRADHMEKSDVLVHFADSTTAVFDTAELGQLRPKHKEPFDQQRT